MPNPALTPIKGTLDVLVLKALTWSPMHGFEITSWLEEHSSRALEVEDSALYQALYRLEARGQVRADWGVTENHRKARYYRITAAGRTHLKNETARLLRYAQTLTTLLTNVPR